MPTTKKAGSAVPNSLAGAFNSNDAKNYGALGSGAAPGYTAPGQINYGTTDWNGLLAGDAGLQFAQNLLSGGSIVDKASRDSAFQRAFIQAGLPLDLTGAASSLGLAPGDLSNIIDPTTQQLAQQNTAAGLSTQARLDQAHQDSIRSIKNALNARGLLGSGETGYQLNKEQQNYTQAEYDSTQRFLDYLSSYQQGYTQAEAQRQAQLAQAASDAATRQAQLHPTGNSLSAHLLRYDGSVPVYQGADGSLWTFKDPNDPNSEAIPYTPQGPAPAPANSQASGGFDAQQALYSSLLGNQSGGRRGGF